MATRCRISNGSRPARRGTAYRFCPWACPPISRPPSSTGRRTCESAPRSSGRGRALDGRRPAERGGAAGPVGVEGRMALPIEQAFVGESMREALVILGSVAIVIPLFHRLKLSPVLGYMLLGVLAGPSGLGALAEQAPWLRLITISDRDRIEPVAELGVELLMFMIGLEMSWERIAKLRRLVFGLGAAQVAGCTAALAAAGWA